MGLFRICAWPPLQGRCCPRLRQPALRAPELMPRPARARAPWWSEQQAHVVRAGPARLPTLRPQGPAATEPGAPPPAGSRAHSRPACQHTECVAACAPVAQLPAQTKIRKNQCTVCKVTVYREDLSKKLLHLQCQSPRPRCGGLRERRRSLWCAQAPDARRQARLHRRGAPRGHA